MHIKNSHLFELNTKSKPSLAIPKPVVVSSKLIEFISTNLVTRLAAVIFSTPFKFKRPQRESYMWKSSQKKMLSVNEINKEVQIVSYGYSKRKILLSHGWAGRSTQLFAFADKLLEKGFMVISFDGPAHGTSSGKKTNMIEFLATIKEIDNTFGPFEAAIGHSFGGMALYNATSTFLNLKTFVAIGSGDKVTDILHNFASNLGLKKSTGTKLITRVEKKWNIKVDDFAASHSAKKIDIPVLIIHDTKDGDVPVSCALNIRPNLRKGHLLITNGLGHTKILRDREIVKKSVEFIIENT